MVDAVKLIGVVEPEEGYRDDERHHDAHHRRGDRGLELFLEKAHVEFEADDKHEEEEAELGANLQEGERRGRKDVLGEAGDAAHHRGAEDDTGEHLGDDERFLQIGEHETEAASERDNDEGLEDEQGDFGVDNIVACDETLGMISEHTNERAVRGRTRLLTTAWTVAVTLGVSETAGGAVVPLMAPRAIKELRFFSEPLMLPMTTMT